jgi:PAS domain S-box-containing protein
MKQKHRSFLAIFLLPVALVAGLATAVTLWSLLTIRNNNQTMNARADESQHILITSLELDQEISHQHQQAISLLLRAASGELDEAGAYLVHARVVDGLMALRQRISELSNFPQVRQAGIRADGNSVQQMVHEFEQYQTFLVTATDIASIDPRTARNYIDKARIAYANFTQHKHLISSRLAQQTREDNQRELALTHDLINRVMTASMGGLVLMLALIFFGVRGLSSRMTHVADALTALTEHATRPPMLPAMERLADKGPGLIQNMAKAVLSFRAALIERQQAEDRLRKLSQAVEQNPSSIVMTNLAGDIEYVNQAFVDATGYTAQEAIGKNPRLLQSGHTSSTNYQELWETLSAGRLWQGEFVNRRKNGEEYVEFARISPMRDAQGNITHYLGIKQDITQRKQMEVELKQHRDHLSELVDARTQALQQSEQELRQAQAMLRNILDTIPVGVYWKGMDLRYMGCNRMFAQDAGVDSPDSLLGKDANATRWRDDVQDYEASDRAIIDNNQGVLNLEHEQTLPDGQTRWLNVSKIPLRDAQQQVIGVLGVYEDITARKKYEQDILEARAQADAASQAKSNFLASMSHELRTPLTAIIGFSQLMRHNPRLTEEFKPQADSIHRAGQHLLELINDLLDMARIEAGKLEVVVQDVTLSAIMQQCLELSRPLADKHQIRLLNTIEPQSERTVRADSTRLKQVLLNLMSNAIKYNRPDGSVTLLLDDAGTNRLRVSVRDTGQGIAPELMAKLFNPFERLGAEKSKVEGTGIGLSITKRILEMMGGTLDVHSEPGVGSTFSVVLQLAHSDPHYLTVQEPET